jgi:hypothetical protein
MEKYNAIRAGIFFVAGLVLILFTEKMIKFQSYVLKKLHIKHRDSKRATRIAGICFWIVSAVLLTFSILN